MPAYLYAILRATDALPSDLPVVAPSGGRLDHLRVGELALAFSPIEAPEALPSRRNMVMHTKILEALNRQGPILPCRFGMIVPSLSALENLIAHQHDRMVAMLAELEGWIELGIRVTLDEKAAIARFVAAEPRLREMSLQTNRASPRDAHRLRLDLGREIAGRLAGARGAVTAEIQALLAGFTEKHVVHAGGDDLTAFNGAFLVKSSDEAAIMAAIERYDAANGDWLSIRCVLPAPPYNFVAFSLASQLQAA